MSSEVTGRSPEGRPPVPGANSRHRYPQKLENPLEREIPNPLTAPALVPAPRAHLLKLTPLRVRVAPRLCPARRPWAWCGRFSVVRSDARITFLPKISSPRGPHSSSNARSRIHALGTDGGSG
jgi:hypothetical protein